MPSAFFKCKYLEISESGITLSGRIFLLHHFYFRRQDFLNWESITAYSVTSYKDMLPATSIPNSPDATGDGIKVE